MEFAGNVLEEALQDAWTNVGDGIAGMCAALHPGKEKEERNPAARVALDLGSDAAESMGETNGERQGNGLKAGRVGAMLPWGYNHVFATNERPHCMNRAAFLFEEWTIDVLVEVVEGELLGSGAVDEPVGGNHAVDQSGGGELLEGEVEALGEQLLACLRQGVYPCGEGFGFKDGEGNHLPAAGCAAGPAGYAEAVGFDL